MSDSTVVLKAVQAMDLAERARRIRLLILDVDGVLTDGSIQYVEDQFELKRFHVRDGSGLKIWRQSGRHIAVISGRESVAVTVRMKELGIETVIQGQSDKLPVFRQLLEHFGLAAEEVCVIGDDLPDLPLLLRAGLGIAVADAARDLLAVADYITTTPGGQGAVRNAIEWLLGLTGDWSVLVERFRAPDSREG